MTTNSFVPSVADFMADPCSSSGETAAFGDPAVSSIQMGFHAPEDFVIATAHGRLLTKQIRRLRNGTIHTTNYDHATVFSYRSVRLTGLAHLYRLLLQLERDNHSASVRGGPLVGVSLDNAARRSKTDGRRTATLGDVPRSYLAIDIDGLDGSAEWWLDLPATLDRVRQVLPPEFRQATAIIQFSSMASPKVKPGISLHLWFWLTTPLTCAELLRTFKPWPKIDRSPFTPATPVYTARPIFKGMDDPLPVRTMLIEGSCASVDVQVLPLPVPQPVAKPSMPILDSEWGPRPAYARVALDGACANIATAPNGKQHTTLFAASAGIGGLVSSGHMPLVLAREQLIAAGHSMVAHGEPWQHAQIVRQVDAGLDAGRATPRTPPPLSTSWSSYKPGNL